ncbi:MAG: hypothetical protein U9Q77_14250 [Candidatus Marinimicrobia bacterium]|nr:hypothetical protein [Candidatus Neomarinimicrobiota bacterium]
MRWSYREISKPGMTGMRWAISGFFFFLAIIKINSMLRFGITPYEQFVIMTGLPEVFKYYGAVACLVELYLAIGIWIKQTFNSAVGVAVGLSCCGAALSIYSLVLKKTTDCHCGLLGDNEYSLLGQKLIIIGALLLLAKNRERLTF